jgi:hypothetical protein
MNTIFVLWRISPLEPRFGVGSSYVTSSYLGTVLDLTEEGTREVVDSQDTFFPLDPIRLVSKTVYSDATELRIP